VTALRVWDVVRVPFPYTDRPVLQRRPALVIATPTADLLWVIMITSAANRGWAGDVDVSDLAGAGLPVPSLVRTAKIATIEARDALPLGTLAPADRDAVVTLLSASLDWRISG
jgi:mRNA interferase MazF